MEPSAAAEAGLLVPSGYAVALGVALGVTLQ
jgi:hypothetical protein